MELTERQVGLLEFVKKMHEGQVRKYTGEGYWNHLFAVAEIVSEHESKGIEAALCHDLFEDTECTSEVLLSELFRIGYNADEGSQINDLVWELTNTYREKDFSFLNRKTRKELECLRLGKISPLAQSIKYADIIHNLGSICEHDKGFAKVFLKEAMKLVGAMRKGNINLFVNCYNSITEGSKKIITLKTTSNNEVIISLPESKAYTNALKEIPKEIQEEVLRDIASLPEVKMYSKRQMEAMYCLGLFNKDVSLDKLVEQLSFAKDRIVTAFEWVDINIK